MEEEKNAAEAEGSGEDKGEDVAAGDTSMAADRQQQHGGTAEPGEEQYQEPENAGDQERPPPRRPFFSQDWIQEVQDAQAGKASKKPTERVALMPMDQKKLMLHMDWDRTTPVVQNEKYLTMAEDETYDGDAQVAWQALLAMNEEELKEWLAKQDTGADVL